jgi:hypothetical protein
MSPRTVEVFKAWIKLNEDEKRDFIKEVLSFNTLTEKEKQIKIKSLEKN